MADRASRVPCLSLSPGDHRRVPTPVNRKWIEGGRGGKSPRVPCFHLGGAQRAYTGRQGLSPSGPPGRRPPGARPASELPQKPGSPAEERQRPQWAGGPGLACPHLPRADAALAQGVCTVPEPPSHRAPLRTFSLYFLQAKWCCGVPGLPQVSCLPHVDSYPVLSVPTHPPDPL